MLHIIKKCCFYKYPYNQIIDYKKLLEFNNLLIKDSIFLGVKFALLQLETPSSIFNTTLNSLMKKYDIKDENINTLLGEHLLLYKNGELPLPTYIEIEKYSDMIKKDGIIQGLEYVIQAQANIENTNKIFTLLETIKTQF